MIGHENIRPVWIQPLYPDRLHIDASQAHTRPCAPHAHAIQKSYVTGEEGPRKTEQRGNGKRSSPESQHEDGADHGRASPDTWDLHVSQAVDPVFNIMLHVGIMLWQAQRLDSHPNCLLMNPRPALSAAAAASRRSPQSRR